MYYLTILMILAIQSVRLDAAACAKVWLVMLAVTALREVGLRAIRAPRRPLDDSGPFAGGGRGG